MADSRTEEKQASYITPLERLAREVVFPFTHCLPAGGEFVYHGLSKRELFAALSMQGLRANGSPNDSAEAAQMAVTDADALLKELAK